MPEDVDIRMPKDVETPIHRGAGAEPPPRRRNRVLALVLIALLIVAAVVAVTGIMKRQQTDAALAKWTAAQAIPTVAVISPKPATGNRELVLPGDIEAYYEAPIYARVNGYLKMWYDDIGARVKAGQLLALIDTPDLDQQLEQAKSDLASVKASAALAELTAKRWQNLLSSNAVSQQTSDEKAGDALAKKALVQAAEAKVHQLDAMEGFKRIIAPFDGVVTARDTDIGALINAGSGGGGTELFKVADIHQMRVYVRVPQAYSAQLHVGMPVTLRLPQYPQQTFPAKLDTTSNAISKESRTVLVELLADNPDGKLWPGTFAEVHFELPPAPGTYDVPTSALLFRSHGLQVATVGPDNKIVMKSLTIARDLGTVVEVERGISPTDRIVDSPPDSLAQGDEVKLAAASGPAISVETPKGEKTASTSDE